jgi:hypothetical protein
VWLKRIYHSFLVAEFEFLMFLTSPLFYERMQASDLLARTLAGKGDLFFAVSRIQATLLVEVVCRLKNAGSLIVFSHFLSLLRFLGPSGFLSGGQPEKLLDFKEVG